jgi:hypothetical protein
MKTMQNKHDYHTWQTPEGIFVSIGQSETLEKSFGPFDTQRKANSAAYNEWRRQQGFRGSIKQKLIASGISSEWADKHLIIY